MKKIIISALALVGMCVMGTESKAQFYAVKDGVIVYQLEEGTVDYIALEKPIKTDFVGEAVDMGLSVKWSSVNLGARSPEESGIRVAWGETEAKDVYNWSTYKYMQEGESDWKYVNKYQFQDAQGGTCWYDADGNFVGDGKTTLEPEDDAAHVNWGGDWRLPTLSDWEEIYKECTYEWTEQNGVNGYKITGRNNGNSIFLPAVGCRRPDYIEYEGLFRGYYWSSSLVASSLVEDCSSYYGYILFISNGGSLSPWGCIDRCSGCSVRPVCPAQGATHGHDAVDLGLSSGNLWATCNIGANEPEANGGYFAWGETQAKASNSYDWSTYKYVIKGGKDWKDINKYTVDDGLQMGGATWYNADEFLGDGKTTLEATDDAATVNWGENWRMPTAKEWKELMNEENCTWSKTSMNGVDGYEVVSKITGNSIFLPASYNWNGHFTGDGYYWSSSLDEYRSSCGSYLYFNLYFNSLGLHISDSSPVSTNYSHYSHYRCNGYSIRPICPVQK
ncbi:MAG: fibrobacter succinogenes major paralogous domain-containing protein [Bacteroidales bacterium]|nr:fibrobacter succinogenes major paralogous domain-containing protein [Bacteroidales bacterium]